MKKMHETQTVFQAEGEPYGTTCNTEPTMTDQAGAADTDLNVIVGKYLGQTNGPAQEPMYGDFTTYPRDLRDYIDTARELQTHHEALPEALQKMPIEELLALTPQDIAAILKPADVPADKPTEAPK